jgi:hypothetical protein
MNMKKVKCAFLVLYALLLLNPANCIKISDNENETTTPLQQTPQSEESTTEEISVTEKYSEDNFRSIDSEESDEKLTTTTTQRNIFKIPPMLHNAKKVESKPVQ